MFARFQAPVEVVDVSTSSLHVTLVSALTISLQDDFGADPTKGEVIYSDDEASEEEDPDAVPVSKRKQKKLSRLSVAELKQLVRKPEVVEWVDVTANDPKLLVQLKIYRNTIPVPSHWSQKKEYLQGKRGVEKAAFQLPSE